MHQIINPNKYIQDIHENFFKITTTHRETEIKVINFQFKVLNLTSQAPFQGKHKNSYPKIPLKPKTKPQSAKAQPKNHRTGESNHQLSNQSLNKGTYKLKSPRFRSNQTKGERVVPGMEISGNEDSRFALKWRVDCTTFTLG